MKIQKCFQIFKLCLILNFHINFVDKQYVRIFRIKIFKNNYMETECLFVACTYYLHSHYTLFFSFKLTVTATVHG